MLTFEFIIALNGNRGNTARVRLQADNAYAAKSLAEAQYGFGNVIGYTQING
jgi:hypothetical protein